jgi:hypothetical protein
MLRKNLFRITGSVKLAVLAGIVLVAAALAGSVRAAVIDHDSVPTIGNDSFTFKDGELDWHFENGKFSVHLVGTLKLDDANGSCARMRLEYFHTGASITTRYGGTVCAPDGKSHEYDVDLNPYADPNVDLVKVSVEKQTASGGSSFSIVESAYFSPSTAPDKVLITSKGVDFGGDTFYSVINDPLNSADFYWNRGDGAAITPRLIGTYWLNKVAGVCARINLRYLTESGTFLASRADTPFCAADDGLDHRRIDLSPYTSTQVEKVDVQLQTQATNGSWNLVDSETVTIGE